MSVIKVDEKNFDSEVRDSKTPVIVDFFADWCGPCKMMGPIFDEVSDKFNDKVKFAKLDVDANQKLALEFSVMSIPTLIVFKDGKAVDTMTGLQDQESLTETAESLSK